MNSKSRPLILVTNDDGIGSPGLLAAVRCVLDLGEVWVVAPQVQQSGSGRSFPVHKVEVEESTLVVDGNPVPAFALNTSPAQAVRNGLLRFVPRRPDLAISGINYGENVGSTVTISSPRCCCVPRSSPAWLPAAAVTWSTSRRRRPRSPPCAP